MEGRVEGRVERRVTHLLFSSLSHVSDSCLKLLASVLPPVPPPPSKAGVVG